MKVFALVCAAAGFVGVAGQDENVFAQACDNKIVGASCTFTQPSGTSTSGTCFSPASPSACGPGYDTSTAKCVMCGEAATGSSGSGSGGNTTVKAMPSAVACTSLAVGDACAFVGADGTKNTGKCADEGPGACGPGYDASGTTCYVCSTDTASTGSGGTVNSASNECTGKSIGDECVIVRGTDSISGFCLDTVEDVDTGDGKMACSPAPPDTTKDTSGDGSADQDPGVSTVLTDACASKSSGASCSYLDGATNAKVTGTCQTDGSRSTTLQCDNDSTASGGTGTSGTATDPLVIACANKQKGATCSANFGVTTISGACDTGEDDALFCSPVLTSQRSLRH